MSLPRIDLFMVFDWLSQIEYLLSSIASQKTTIQLVFEKDFVQEFRKEWQKLFLKK